MSDWGRVALYYDFEKDSKRTRKETGLISKAYKYPGVVGMILHAYYGMRYFMECFEDDYLHFEEGYDSDSMGLYAELNTAFDVFFDYGSVDIGYDGVRSILERRREAALEGNTEKVDEDEERDLLFNCEGSYGWLFLKFTGSKESGYTMKYGYYYGSREYKYEVADLKRAVEIESKYNSEFAEALEDEVIREAITFIEENAELMSEEEFWDVEDLGYAWVKAQVMI